MASMAGGAGGAGVACVAGVAGMAGVVESGKCGYSVAGVKYGRCDQFGSHG